MRARRLTVAALFAFGLLIFSGLFINGPQAFRAPLWMYPPLDIAFIASALTMFALGALYLARTCRAWCQGRTWAPLLVFGSVFLAAVVYLIVLNFLFPLWSEILFMLFYVHPANGFETYPAIAGPVLGMATAAFSGIGLVLLVAMRLVAMVLRSKGQRRLQA